MGYAMPKFDSFVCSNQNYIQLSIGVLKKKQKKKKKKKPPKNYHLCLIITSLHSYMVSTIVYNTNPLYTIISTNLFNHLFA